MKKICKYCGKEFETNNPKKMFCSHSHCMKQKWQDAEYRNKQQSIKNSDQYKKNLSEKLTNMWSTDEYRNSQQKKITKKWSDPQHMQHMTKRMKQQWSDPAYRAALVDSFIKGWDDDSRRKNISEKIKAKWRDPEWVETFGKRCFKFKEYMLPSGTIVKIQGYEGIALDMLLETYNENDLCIEYKDIFSTIGKISYTYNNNVHTYIPDIFIKSENKIIEVKSDWTFNLHKEKNLAKEQACLQQGFNFEFIIL